MRTKKGKRSGKLIAAIVLLLILTGGAVSYIIKTDHTRGESVSAADTAVVVRADIKSELSSTGVLKPKDTYNVTSLVEGEITSADFSEGDRVEKGQVLYRIDVSNMEAEMTAASGSLERSERGYGDAKRDYDQAKARFGDMIYRSGESGYIKKIYVKEGEKASTGTKLADIYDDRIMRLKLPFLSAEAEMITVGNQAVVTLAATGEQLPGTVTAVSQKEEVLTGGRLVRYVTIEVANPGGLTSEHSATATVSDYSGSMEGIFSPVVETVMSADLPDTVTVEKFLAAEGDFVEINSPVFRFDAQSGEKMMRTYQNALDSAKENLEGARNKLDSTKNNIENYTVTAPISGTVIKKNTKAGDKLNRSGDNSTMAVIYDLSAITFSMSVDELDITKVKSGQRVEITAEAAGGKTYEGTVTGVSLESSNSNGISTYPVTVTMEASEGLLPGMNVNGRILLENSENAMVVPAGSLMRGNMVYVKDPSVTESVGAVPAGFREVTVETGIISDTLVEIKSGLSEGDEVYVLPGDTQAAGDYEMAEMDMAM